MRRWLAEPGQRKVCKVTTAYPVAGWVLIRLNQPRLECCRLSIRAWRVTNSFSEPE